MYVATIHFPYAVACDEQVVVVCNAKRFKGLVEFCADCMVVENVRVHVYILHITFGLTAVDNCKHAQVLLNLNFNV